MRAVSQILKMWDENILLRFDLTIRNTEKTQQWVGIYYNIGICCICCMYTWVWVVLLDMIRNMRCWVRYF